MLEASHLLRGFYLAKNLFFLPQMELSNQNGVTGSWDTAMLKSIGMIISPFSQ